MKLPDVLPEILRHPAVDIERTTLVPLAHDHDVWFLGVKPHVPKCQREGFINPASRAVRKGHQDDIPIAGFRAGVRCVQDSLDSLLAETDDLSITTFQAVDSSCLHVELAILYITGGCIFQVRPDYGQSCVIFIYYLFN